MIEVEGLSFGYPDAADELFTEVDLTVEAGEFCLLIGPTGSGKSTLLGVINNLVPLRSGGRRVGRISLAGEDVSRLPPRELADRVGWIGQDPVAGFVTDTVEAELVWTMEQLGVPAGVMRLRLEETLDLLGIADLRARALRTLSGGQRQRVAIGAALTARPAILLMDEPTSALDPVAAEEVVGLVRRLVHDHGTTVVLAEHRLERVIEHVDSVIELAGGGLVLKGSPQSVMASAPFVPPLVALGRDLGWSPLPLDIRDGRRAASEVRTALARTPQPTPTPARSADQPVVLEAEGLIVRYGPQVAVAGVDLSLRAGQVMALMGRNGAGKSSLLWALQGALRPVAGRVRTDALATLVPQEPADLLYLETVEQECAEADRRSGRAVGTTAVRLHELVGQVDPQAHPRDLSEGQQLALVLALQLSGEAEVVLLDEPTRGLDPRAKAELGSVLSDLAARGRTVLVATHDVEFVARTCDRVAVMAEGELIAEGPARSVLAGSALLSTQVSKVMAPLPYLTAAEVVEALGVTGHRQATASDRAER